ncbi:MAG: hypothetical protein RI962_1348, partial [Pseudomonadota bacterium]
IAMRDRIEKFLQQDLHDGVGHEKTWQGIRELVGA